MSSGPETAVQFLTVCNELGEMSKDVLVNPTICLMCRNLHIKLLPVRRVFAGGISISIYIKPDTANIPGQN